MIRAALLSLVLAAVAFAGGGSENVLVVQNDLCPDSIEVARYYMAQRDIPRHHLVHVQVPGAVKPPKKDNKAPKKGEKPVPVVDDGYDSREAFTTFDEYQKLLEAPVMAWLKANPGEPITVIALTRGIPVATNAKNSNNGDVVRATTHILAQMFCEGDALHTGPTGHTGVASPFYKHDKSIDPAAPIDGKYPIYCVGMLDAFSVADIKKAIDLSIVSDGKRPDGTVYLGVSAQNDPRGMYNPDFPALKDFLVALGLKTEVVAHNPNKILLEGKKDVALFMYGQANWDATFPAKNTYQPGCLVDNLTSVALTWRAFNEGAGGGQTPMTHFLRAGATVIHGCVREPTTGAWDRNHLHLHRYAEGYNVIESYFMGHPWFPWMNLVVGDPLTQPFARRPIVTTALGGEKGAWTLQVGAQTARADAKIAKLLVYLDGVKIAEPDNGGTVPMPVDFDPAINQWRVVAIDDSKFRTQGFSASEPIKKDTSKVSAKLDGYFKGSAALRLSHDGKEPVVTWVAPDSRAKTGTVKGARFSIQFEDESVPHKIELWVRNAKEVNPIVLTVDVPAKKK